MRHDSSSIFYFCEKNDGQAEDRIPTLDRHLEITAIETAESPKNLERLPPLPVA